MASEKILILDDDASVARAYETVLREGGSEVIVCTRFEEARQQLKERQPDAVLTDIRVGEYNGLQLAHLFRSYSPKGRLVVITGYDDAVLRNEVRRLGGEFILKPVAVKDLRSAFRSTQSPRTAPASDA